MSVTLGFMRSKLKSCVRAKFRCDKLACLKSIVIRSYWLRIESLFCWIVGAKIT